MQRSYQCRQLGTVTDFSVCNLNQLAPIITVVTTNPVHVDCAVTTIDQLYPTPASMSGIYDSSSQGEGSRFPNPQSTYHTILAVFLCQSITKTHRQFFFLPGPLTFPLTDSHSECLKPAPHCYS